MDSPASEHVPARRAGGGHGAATHEHEGASAAAPAPGPVSLPEGNTPTPPVWSPQEATGPGDPTWWLTPADHHAAEAWATRPWEDDTGTFTAICAEVTR